MLLFLLTGVRIANLCERAVNFRLGRYARTSGPGLCLLLPLIEWQWTIDMRTMTTAVEQQEARPDRRPFDLSPDHLRSLAASAGVYATRASDTANAPGYQAAAAILSSEASQRLHQTKFANKA
ncbi:MAG: hypothetical protein ACREDM_15650 [Methylocella sp.]